MIKINDTYEAENISQYCVNPYAVKFDLWDRGEKDFAAEDVNALAALEERLIDLDTAAAILEEAGMSYILTRDNTDPEGFMFEESALIDADATDSGLYPMVQPVREWLEDIF